LRYGKEAEQPGNANRQRDQPMRHIACPRPERGVEPRQRQNREHCASHFVKKLLESPPKAAKTCFLRRWLRCAA